MLARARFDVRELAPLVRCPMLYAKLNVEGRPQAIMLLRAAGFGGQAPFP